MRAKMSNPMQAFWDGLAKFIDSFWQSASRQGFAIMLLLFTNIVLAYWVSAINDTRKEEWLSHKAEIAELRNECRSELNYLRSVIDTLREEMQSCAEARARLEAQNIILKRNLFKVKNH
jgi:hypothetical protein